MKKSKFTEAQIAFAVRTVLDRYACGGGLQKNEHQRGYV